MSAEEELHTHDESPHDLPGAPEVAPIEATPEHGFWKSLRELDGQAPFQLTGPSMREFAPGSDQAPRDPMSRRNFFQLMGASMALAGVGAAGCRRYEKEEIVPLGRRPEDQTPGVTQQYATGYDLGGVGHALIATAFEGRPIHLDGNPEHPWASGGIVAGTERRAGASTFAQAAILHLYDPDRSQSVLAQGKGASLDAFRSQLPAIREKLGTAHVLSEATSSPTVRALRDQLIAKYPGLQWHEYEPLSWDNERLGTAMAFGHSVRPLARLDRAQTIVTIDCDLFVEHPAALRYNRDFARSRQGVRDADGTIDVDRINRLWAIESTFTNTGALADHRLPLRSELGLPFALALDSALGGGSAMPNAEFLKETKIADFFRVLVAELKANNGKAVVIAGRRQSPAVHALVARINEKIGALGKTLSYVEDPDGNRPSHLAAISQLAADMAAGKVQTLIMIGGNPVYDAPVDTDFAANLAKVATSIHLSEYANETSLKSGWHVPKAHFLEAWGDVRTWDGTVTLAQPIIAPLYGSVATSELLAMLLGTDQSSEQLVRAAHEAAQVGGSWRQNVHDGFAPAGGLKAADVTTGNIAPPALTPSQMGGTLLKNGDLEITFHYSSFSYDGRFANNAWLQETPDFFTKVTWDNYALVGPHTAVALGLENDTMITVEVDGHKLELPCYTMPGQAKFSIALVLGGGRTAAGSVGGMGDKNRVGWDTNKVRTKAGFDYATKGKATGGGAAYELASIQEHWDIRAGLKIVNSRYVYRDDADVNAKGLNDRLPAPGPHGEDAHPDSIVKFIQHDVLASKDEKDRAWKAEEKEGFFNDLGLAGNHDRPGEGGYSLFKEKDYNGHRWAMAIDLSTCTGCNSCMVACQSENNVPVVGRQEVKNNREMSWIRIDRYFSGTPENPTIVHQPVACQHCEQAPCETVCPVGATTHSDEGLNDMAYNRCIGTRYCANNCPYKVRRFNFLDWNKEFREARNKVRRLLFNPDVTVRMRGVMEKCSYCVQRIQNAKIKAKAQIRSGQRPGTVTGPLPDGEVETACQQACPTEAIVFGDLSDPNSRVSRLHEDRRSYALLPETYTKPRTRFLARVRNQNPALVEKAPTTGGRE